MDIAEIEIILRSVFLYIPGRERDSPSSLLVLLDVCITVLTDCGK